LQRWVFLKGAVFALGEEIGWRGFLDIAQKVAQGLAEYFRLSGDKREFLNQSQQRLCVIEGFAPAWEGLPGGAVVSPDATIQGMRPGTNGNRSLSIVGSQIALGDGLPIYFRKTDVVAVPAGREYDISGNGRAFDRKRRIARNQVFDGEPTGLRQGAARLIHEIDAGLIQFFFADAVDHDMTICL